MKRNKFSLSHYKLLTGNAGNLIPITWYEALPGDTTQQQTSILLRVTPMLSPIMHPLAIRIHHWFVPYRLIWDDFQDFITGGATGNDTTSPPTLNINYAINEGTLSDYLGIPPADYTANPLTYSALPIRAYQMIWNEHYRDQDLETLAVVSTGNGADSTTSRDIKNVCFEKDYFTAARPWEQKGTEINIPLIGDAPVTGLGVANTTFGAGANAYETDGSGTVAYAAKKDPGTGVLNDAIYIEEDPLNSGYPNIRADLSAASGLSANDLRLYMALQRYKEATAEYGSRYVEWLQHQFGVRSSDGRLGNPEYLGGGRNLVSFSEILSTADSGTDVVGQLRGHGLGAMRTNRFRRFFEEHGIVMSLMSIVPKAIYANGMHRSWSKSTKEDYYQKQLAYIGDQSILNKEVYTEHTTRDGIFGYQQRYDEYRHHPSNIAGEFHSSLNHWHYARLFSSDPSLNAAFVKCDPVKRQYADNASDSFYVMANHSIQSRRVLPKYPKKRLM